MLRKLLDQQISLSRAFDRLLPEGMVRHGGSIYIDEVVPRLIHPGLKVMDVGSGRFPVIKTAEKGRLGLHVTGLDLNRAELDAAPDGSYDDAVQADITCYQGKGDKDLVVCMSVLEHVTDTAAALKSIATIVRPGGVVALFVPSRNALFARLNLLLPQRVTRWLLKYKPGAHGGDGWKSYYNRCTPGDFRNMAKAAGLEVVRIEPAYISTYFQVFAPVYVIWRFWMLAFRAVRGEQAAETFCIELRRPTR
jgi:2-polyprenyl-6-hydroxyphenyl methylase/3-demethylubiquinone-9 3-methyltransferase